MPMVSGTMRGQRLRAGCAWGLPFHRGVRAGRAVARLCGKGPLLGRGPGLRPLRRQEVLDAAAAAIIVSVVHGGPAGVRLAPARRVLRLFFKRTRRHHPRSALIGRKASDQRVSPLRYQQRESFRVRVLIRRLDAEKIKSQKQAGLHH